MKARDRAGVALALVAAAIIAGYRRTSDGDFFWHVTLGRVAMATRSTLPTDLFSYSFAGAPLKHKDLVADVLLALSLQTLGWAGVLLCKVLVVIALGAAFFVGCPSLRRAPSVAVVGTAAILGAILLVERPNLFSLAAFALTFALTTRALAADEASSGRSLARRFAPPVVAVWAWTNLHRFALVGQLLVLGVALLLGLRMLLGRTAVGQRLGPLPPSRTLAAAALAAVACPVVSLLNPSGVAVFSSIGVMSTSPELRASFTEWQHLPLTTMAVAFPVGCLLVVLAFAALLVGARSARARPSARLELVFHAVVWLALVGLTEISIRWMQYAAIASAQIAVWQLFAAASRSSDGRTALPRGAGALAVVVALALLYLQRADEPLALGEDPAACPAGAAAYARDRGLDGKAVTSFDLGGYLLFHEWPGVRVLVDGRNEILYPPSFVLRCLRAEHDAATFAAMRAEDHATWTFGINEPERNAYAFLSRDPAWALVYWSTAGTIYVRRDRYPALADDELRFVDPGDVLGSLGGALTRAYGHRDETAERTRAEVHHEIERMLDASPDDPRPNLALAFFAHLERQDEVRDRVLTRLLTLHPDDATVQQMADAIRAIRR